MSPFPVVPDSLRLIGWPFAAGEGSPEWRDVFAAHPGARPMRVVEQHRSGYVVADAPDVAVKAESPPEWMRPPGFKKASTPNHERAAVGDWVLVEGDAPSRSRIAALLPRRSAIKRGAAGEHYHQQVIAANIDTVFVVVGLDDDFNPRRIERYLLLVGGGGARTAAPQPVVVLTKADKREAGGGDAQATLAALAQFDAPAFAVNAKDRASVAALDGFLGEGRTVVLVGSSGAGKSTLTNTLLGVEKMKTGAVRESDSRGRHTTTHRALIALPTGACLIDTPGMRELKPTGEEDLAEGGFADIEALAAQCRFRDCTHRNEPGCAVRAAIERGELEPARLANYLKLRDEVAGAADKLAQRLAQKADARVQNKALRKRLDEKRGKH
ncbi:MAG: ribosome small subunit-dependent GTPase A [Pseudoxanthomonas sp.]